MPKGGAQTSGLSRRKYQYAQLLRAIANKSLVRRELNPESTLDPASPSQSHGLQLKAESHVGNAAVGGVTGQFDGLGGQRLIHHMSQCLLRVI
jgi:hypothetical protein